MIRYVFCINSGRSGSDYLTELFLHAENAVSLHEAGPVMNGEPMQRWNAGDAAPLQALMPAKLRAMKAARRGDDRVYCETNHAFIKGFGYLVPRALPQEQIAVIDLRRDVEQTVYSLLRVRDLPGASAWSRLWYLAPDAPHNLSVPRERTRDGLCRWYLDEIRLRAAEFRERFPRITYLDCEVEQLNDLAFVQELFRRLGLVPAPSLRRAVGTPLNVRGEWPRLPLEQLLAPPCHPSADALPPRERDELLAAMIAHLKRTRGRELAAARPDLAMHGSILNDLITLVAEAEPELESRFGRALLFTDTEWVLIFELLYTVRPHDVYFVLARRRPGPGIRYDFDFNVAQSVGLLLRRLGPRGLARAAWLVAQGRWRQDVTHRRAAP